MNGLVSFRFHFVVVHLLPQQLPTDSVACHHCLRLSPPLHLHLHLYSASWMMSETIDIVFGTGLGFCIWWRRWQDVAGREALSVASGRVLEGSDREGEIDNCGDLQVQRREALDKPFPVQQFPQKPFRSKRERS